MLMAAAGDDASNEMELFDMIGNLIWAGCVAEDPTVTVEQIFDGLGMNPAEQILPIFEAIQRAMPDAEVGAPLAKAPSRSGRTGGRSGRSAAQS